MRSCKIRFLVATNWYEKFKSTQMKEQQHIHWTWMEVLIPGAAHWSQSRFDNTVRQRILGSFDCSHSKFDDCLIMNLSTVKVLSSSGIKDTDLCSPPFSFEENHSIRVIVPLSNNILSSHYCNQKQTWSREWLILRDAWGPTLVPDMCIKGPAESPIFFFEGIEFELHNNLSSRPLVVGIIGVLVLKKIQSELFSLMGS